MATDGVQYGPDCPLRIIALTRTCRANPSQWEGESEHHAAVYIRERYDDAYVLVGPSMETALNRLYAGGEPVYEWIGEFREDGMTLAALRAVLPDWIEIAPDTEAARQEAGE